MFMDSRHAVRKEEMQKTRCGTILGNALRNAITDKVRD
jgi:hypothetical protein